MASRAVSRITLKWLALVVRGVAATLIGIAAFVWPGITVPGLVLLFGAYALAHGILSLVQAFGRETDDRWLAILEGLVGIAVGIAAFVWPEVTGQALLLVIAGWAIMIGLVQITPALWTHKLTKRDWLLMLRGLLLVVFGVILAAAPGVGGRVVIWVVGACALLLGVLDLVLGFRLRSITRRWGDSHHARLSA